MELKGARRGQNKVLGKSDFKTMHNIVASLHKVKISEDTRSKDHCKASNASPRYCPLSPSHTLSKHHVSFHESCLSKTPHESTSNDTIRNFLLMNPVGICFVKMLLKSQCFKGISDDHFGMQMSTTDDSQNSY